MSKRITLVAATEQEIAPFMAYLHEKGIAHSPKTFEIQGLSIDIVITGIGTLNTTYQLMAYLQEAHSDGWIQIGIGGALDTALGIGEVFQIKSEMIYGEGAEDKDGNLLNPFALGWIKGDENPFSNGLLSCPYRSLVKEATGMTTFYAHGATTAIEKLKKSPYGQIENMEGAPFFYISLMKKIPFLSIRSISNLVASRDKSNWNIPLAITNSNQTIIQLLEGSSFDVQRLFQYGVD